MDAYLNSKSIVDTSKEKKYILFTVRTYLISHYIHLYIIGHYNPLVRLTICVLYISEDTEIKTILFTFRVFQEIC